MKTVKLLGGITIENCSDSTTSNAIYAERGSYGEAGAVRDLFTSENSDVVKVYQNGEVVDTGADLVLLPGCSITNPSEDVFVCEVTLRTKSDTEKMQEEIAELQEAVIG